ncbi:MAG TPA: acyl-CoA thioesterase II, partial [Pseudomonadales bacterium]|nr:acyl-CoA thioesterase II [Pseudomonadales bacterium]
APIVYEVDRQRDGGSFTTRRVVAIQHGQPIFNLAASFQVKEPGAEHQADAMPDLPGPDGLMSEAELRKRVVQFVPEKMRDVFMQPRPIEMRPINPTNPFNPVKTEPHKAVWMRADGKMGDDMRMHQAVLAYVSDFHLLGTCMLPHAMSFVQPNVQAASLDHTIWFHHDFRADDWLLYAMDSPWASNARGLNRGRVFNQAGKLIATVMQEGLIRDRSVVK